MDRKAFIAGNWKMHTTLETALDLAKAVKETAQKYGDREVAIAPPFPFLLPIKDQLKGSGVFLSAQNMHPEEKGAFTGEVSPLMLKSVGCTHVILGHSERRQYFQEKDEFINKKLLSALKCGLVPVLCIGETLEEREQGKTFDVVKAQLVGGLKGIESLGDPKGLLIAYEPVWAIGTGRNATPQQAQEVHAFIRENLRLLLGDKTSEGIRILYGGSVTPENIDSLMAERDVDGVLVGGASLDATKFSRIIGFLK